jgi:hypothetical protein
MKRIPIYAISPVLKFAFLPELEYVFQPHQVCIEPNLQSTRVAAQFVFDQHCWTAVSKAVRSRCLWGSMAA